MIGLMIALTLQAVPLQTAQPPTVALMVVSEVDARRAKPGDVVRMRLHRPLSIGDRTIEVGTPAFGEVVPAGIPSGQRQSGALAMRVTHLQDGAERIALAGDLQSKARGGKHDDAVRFLLAPVHALFAVRNAAKLKAGDVIEVALARDTAAAP